MGDVPNPALFPVISFCRRSRRALQHRGAITAMLIAAGLLLALPGGIVAYAARSVIGVPAPPPVCVAQPANGPPLIQDARCPLTRRPQRSHSASSSDPA